MDCAAQVQATLRCSLLCAFVSRSLLHSFDAKETLADQHSGFSVGAGGQLNITRT